MKRLITTAAVGAIAIAACGWMGYRIFRTSHPVAVPLPENIDQASTQTLQLIEDGAADVKAVPDDASRWITLAMIYEANDYPDLAEQTYEQALSIDPSRPKAWYHLALLREYAGDMEGAIAAMRRSIQLKDDFAPSYWRLGQFLFDQDEVEPARKAFETSRRIDRHDPTPQIGLARIALHQNRPRETISTLEKVISASSQPLPHAYQLLGLAQSRLGSNEAAELSFQRAQSEQLQPYDPWLREVQQYNPSSTRKLERVKHLARKKHFQQAFALLNELLREQPNNERIRTNLAVIHRMAGNLQQSNSVLETILASNEGSARAHFNLAVNGLLVMHRSNAVDRNLIAKTLAHARRAVEINPANADALGILGDIFIRVGKPDEAISFYDQAAGIEPANLKWLCKLGLAQVKAGRNNEAINTLEHAVKFAPAFPAAHDALGKAYAAAGRAREAAAAAAEARTLSKRRGGR